MKTLILALGFISFGLGAVGIVVPVLPTTPFFLLAGICFAKGSDRVNNWFKGTKMYEHYVKSYIERGGMTKKRKITLLSMVTVLFMIGLYFMESLHIRIFMIVVLLAHYYYFIFRMKTLEDEE